MTDCAPRDTELSKKETSDISLDPIRLAPNGIAKTHGGSIAASVRQDAAATAELRMDGVAPVEAPEGDRRLGGPLGEPLGESRVRGAAESVQRAGVSFASVPLTGGGCYIRR